MKSTDRDTVRPARSGGRRRNAHGFQEQKDATMVSEAQKKANAKHNKGKTKQLAIRFSPNEMDMLDFIKSHDNITGYIKGLARADMERRV